MAAGSTMIERVVSYATQQCWELPATILEGIALVSAEPTAAAAAV
jgi:hypothetical protein